MHKGGGAGAMAGAEDDGIGVANSDQAHYVLPRTVVRTSATTVQGSA